jgi:phage terminase large subunit-like protein
MSRTSKKWATVERQAAAVKNAELRTQILNVLDSARTNGADTAAEILVAAGRQRNEQGHVLTNDDAEMIDEQSYHSILAAVDCHNADRALSKRALNWFINRNLY